MRTVPDQIQSLRELLRASSQSLPPLKLMANLDKLRRVSCHKAATSNQDGLVALQAVFEDTDRLRDLLTEPMALGGEAVDGVALRPGKAGRGVGG
jgi:hypothetical protein